MTLSFASFSSPARKISIRRNLSDQETLERETASFEVELSHADVEGVWHKDGLRVKSSGQMRVSANGRVHGLTLSNLSLEDTGTIAFSAEGVRTTARLTVKGRKRKGPLEERRKEPGEHGGKFFVGTLAETPVSILKTLSDQRVEEDLPATLECELSKQIVEVKWLKVRARSMYLFHAVVLN